ncbi:MAG TPA: type II secretion system F family protein [Bryobacteraceae bacterium]|nr:type II secretion system F family protein [Bryobacteraceae bacterium]
MAFFVIVLAAVWAVALGGWWIVSRLFRNADADRMKARLVGGAKKQAKPGTPQAALFENQESDKGKIVLQLLKKYNLTDRTRKLLEQAGLKWNLARFVHGCMGLFIGSYVALYLFIPSAYRPYALLASVAAGFLPLLYVMRLRKKRLHAFEEIFPDSLEFVSRSMRAGHAFSVSLEMIHREFQEPLSSEFRRTFEEHNLGLPLDVALLKLSQRVPLLDVQFFVSAVLLQKRTGGNLAEILDKLAYVIRERFKLRGRIRAVSAHGKMTSLALTCIPIGVAVLMFYTNPDYVKFFFTDEVGQQMMAVAVALQVAGYFIMRKIVSIEV